MTRITASIDIAAPREAVWRVLLDWGAYPEWNPTLRAIAGQARKGAKIKVSVASPVGVVPIAAEVIQLTANAGITWRSRLPLSGLLDRDHIIDLASAPDGTRVTQTQTFSGMLAPPTAALGAGTVREGLERMNAALKERVEGAAP